MQLGPCAKTRVTCQVKTDSGLFIYGENLCANPQSVCPRLPGEGYEKCKSICLQIGHAEQVAAALVRSMGVRGKTAMIDGHFYACDNCLRALHSIGVKEVLCVDPPPASMSDELESAWERYVNADLSGAEVVFRGEE